MIKHSIWTIVFMLTATAHLTNSSGKESKRCFVDRVHKMIAYNCASLGLKEIPKYLKATTEILDASENRIRKLTRASFSLYPDMKFLYLFDNSIVKIEAGTFSQLKHLEALDLTQNAFRFVPPEIFNLPNLRKLYLAENDLGNEGFSKIQKPVKAPLVALSIANTEIDRIPDFGILPELLDLNVSMNVLKYFVPEQFAVLCQIKHVDLNRTNVGSCQCHKVNMFVEHELQRHPILQCGAVPTSCKLDPNATYSETKDYQRCLVVKEELKNSRNSIVAEVPWPLIGFCSLIGLLFIVMLCAHCRQPPKARSHPIELILDPDLQVNPNSRSTLIM